MGQSNRRQPHWFVIVVVGLILGLPLAWFGINDIRIHLTGLPLPGGSSSAPSCPRLFDPGTSFSSRSRLSLPLRKRAPLSLPARRCPDTLC